MQTRLLTEGRKYNPFRIAGWHTFKCSCWDGTEQMIQVLLFLRASAYLLQGGRLLCKVMHAWLQEPGLAVEQVDVGTNRQLAFSVKETHHLVSDDISCKSLCVSSGATACKQGNSVKTGNPRRDLCHMLTNTKGEPHARPNNSSSCLKN